LFPVHLGLRIDAGYSVDQLFGGSQHRIEKGLLSVKNSEQVKPDRLHAQSDAKQEKAYCAKFGTSIFSYLPAFAAERAAGTGGRQRRSWRRARMNSRWINDC